MQFGPFLSLQPNYVVKYDLAFFVVVPKVTEELRFKKKKKITPPPDAQRNKI